MTDSRTIPYSEQDIDAYSQHIAKLAAIAAPGDPAAPTFRLWFYWRYGAMPQERLAAIRNPRRQQAPQQTAA